MAIKSSGALSFATDIVGEFADSAPHSMSEFYGGGDKVPAGANPGVATSGEINFNSFYDCVAATVLTISSNTNDYNIGTACIAAGGDKSTPVILTINSGVTVGSSGSTVPAMKTDTGWSSGVSITITNNGSIVGSSGSNSSGPGGTGGSGGHGHVSVSNGGSGSTGSGSAESANNGGDAFEHSQTADNNLSVIFDTAGTRTGGSAGTRTFLGGGGGGGGGNMYCYSNDGCGSGGGGGGGANGGSGGGGGTGGWSNSGANTNGGSGSAGGATTGGSGGGGGYIGAYDYKGRAGASGGNLGSSGGNANGGSGGGAGSSGYTSGSAGSSLSGNTGQIS